MKRSLTVPRLLLAAAVLLCLAVLPVSAESPAVTLEADAVLDDVSFPAAGEELILDLNGHTLAPADPSVTVTTALAGTLTIRDSSPEQTGTLTACRFQIVEGGVLTLEGGAFTGCSLEGAGSFARVEPGGTLNVAGGVITGNQTTGANSGGAVIVAGGRLVMSGGSIADNVCLGGSGGAVYVSASGNEIGSFTMTGGSISGNKAANLGGAVFLNNGGVFTMSGGVISGNESTNTGATYGRGGGVYIYKGSFTMTDGVISGNAAACAGAVGVREGTFAMSGGSLTGNKAGLRSEDGALTGGASGIGGGAIGTWMSSSVVEITGGEITDNQSYAQGGAISIYVGRVTLENVTVSGNTLAKADNCYGGAFFVGGITVSETESAKMHRLTIGQGTLVTGNGAAAALSGSKYLYGAAGFAGRGGEIVMNGGTVTGHDCSAARGVFHIYGSSPGHMTMNGGEITDNSGRGGAVWVASGGDFTMNGGAITGNRASSQSGAGVSVAGGTFTMTGGVISGNSTKNKLNGGGVSSTDGGSFFMSGGSIIGNSAAACGGGLAVTGTSSAVLSGGEIRNNESVTIKCDLYLYGSAPRFTMTGGLLGDSGSGQNALWVWNGSGSNVAHVDIYGGTVDGILGASGDNETNDINIRGGYVHRISETHIGVTATGGKFRNSSYLSAVAAEGTEVAGSGEEDFRYTVVPVLDRTIALNAAGTALEASLDGAETCWTVSADGGAAVLRAPVTASLLVDGEPKANAVPVTLEDGRYVLSAPIAPADRGGQYRLTLLDAEGATIRAFVDLIPLASTHTPGGDLNGDGKQNAKDVVILQRYMAGGYDVELDATAADLNEDGKRNAKDVVLLQRAIAGGYDVELTGHDILTTAQRALRAYAESMLIRGPRAQYDALQLVPSNSVGVSRCVVASRRPESYTSQYLGYTNCSAFTYDAYYFGLGYNIKNHNTADLIKVNDETRVFYRTFTGNETEEERAAIEQQFTETLQPGDIVCYRRTDSTGHAMLYVGDGRLIHSSAGSGLGSYDYPNKREKYEPLGTMYLATDIHQYFFEESGTNRQFLFGGIVNKAIILRPLISWKDEVPAQSLARIRNMSGIVAEKLCSRTMGQTVLPGETLTYTVRIENHNNKAVTLRVEDVAPEHTVPVSDGPLSWDVTVPAGETGSVSYTVRVDDDPALVGTRIVSNQATVGGVTCFCPAVFVGGHLTDGEKAQLAQAAAAASDAAGWDRAAEIYASVDLDLKAILPAPETIVPSLFPTSTTAGFFYLTSTSPYYRTVAPAMYGGRQVRAGTNFNSTRTRGPLLSQLEVGDLVIWTDSSDESPAAADLDLMLITGEDTVLRLTGEAPAVLTGEDAQNALYTLLGYNKFVILRPAMQR